MSGVIEVNFGFIDDSGQLLDGRVIAVGSRQTPVRSSRRELAVLNTYVGRLFVHTLSLLRTASTTAAGWVNGIMCAAPRTTSVAARNAGASCRAVAKGGRERFFADEDGRPWRRLGKVREPGAIRPGCDHFEPNLRDQ